MQNKSLLIFISSVVVLFLGVFISDQLGYWSTQSSGDFLSGDKDTVTMEFPDELRGSTTFGEIESAFNIPASLLAKAYNFDSREPSLIKVMYVSDAFAYLGEDVEMGTGSVKMFIYLYKGLDTSHLEEIENLPSTAVDVLKEEGKWTDVSETLMTDHIILIDEGLFLDATISDIMEEDSHETSAEVLAGTLEINGNTTINDIIIAGLSLETIEATLGVEVANVNLGFRDICEENDLEFSTKKNELMLLFGEN